jgi:hypothetical protein
MSDSSEYKGSDTTADQSIHSLAAKCASEAETISVLAKRLSDTIEQGPIKRARIAPTTLPTCPEGFVDGKGGLVIYLDQSSPRTDPYLVVPLAVAEAQLRKIFIKANTFADLVRALQAMLNVRVYANPDAHQKKANALHKLFRGAWSGYEAERDEYHHVGVFNAMYFVSLNFEVDEVEGDGDVGTD